jgi:hypothetical protein
VSSVEVIGSLPDVRLRAETLQEGSSPGDGTKNMKNSTQPELFLYSEKEAARELGISLARLHQILDDNIFNDGTPRPAEMTFQGSDLVLLSFWSRSTPNPKVLRMPRRL